MQNKLYEDLDAVDKFYRNMERLVGPRVATARGHAFPPLKPVAGGSKRERERRQMQRLSFHNTEKVERA